MSVTYMLNFLDKGVLSNASVFGLITDLVSIVHTKVEDQLTNHAETFWFAVQLGWFNPLPWVSAVGAVE